MESRQTNPIQDLFVNIEKIINFMEVKDLNEAMKYETSEIKSDSEMWMGAMMETDTYLTYKKFWNIAMFQEVLSSAKINNIRLWMEKPHNIPLDFRENLLKRGREVFLNSYEEKNTYYRMINGLPPYGTPKSEFIYLSEPMRNQLHAPINVPVHELSPLVQNTYMSTDEYKSIIEKNPDKKYLKYLGLYKIDIFTARRARDFELIRYPTNSSDINPNLIREFGTLYSEYREYVMSELYNKHLEGIYNNYRTFMGMLITSFVLMQISNKAVEAINGRKFLDDSVLHDVLSMHGIPRSLLMTREVRRNLVINMLKLRREKSTNDVYYSLVKLLDYQDIIVSKLMLMKGQKFDEDNNYQASFENGEPLKDLNDINKIGSMISEQNGNYDESVKGLDVEPFFVQLDLLDPDPYDTIINGKAPIHDYHKITDPDPTWWNLSDTQQLLRNTNYTIADTKYIIIEAVIHQIQYLFESIYFMRMILDNKKYTDEFLMNIPEIFGVEPVSMYDLMVYILAATCMNNGLTGEINGNNSMSATAGFNFDIDLDLFEEYINETQYVDKEKIMAFIEDLTMRDPSDINRLFNDVMYPMREWLETKISQSINRLEFLEYESIYRALYTYDASRNNFLNDFQSPIEIIQNKYQLTSEEIEAYLHFYPRTMTGESITIETFPSSRYKNPFLNYNNEVTWKFHIIIETPYGEEDRGYVYFHDILNSPDLRELTNPDGTRVFMNWEDNEIGWEVNHRAVEKILYLIDGIEEHELHSAFFQVNTPVLNSGGKMFKEGEKLPASIRNGIFKEILKDKILMDMNGLAVPPKTYIEYLYRKNQKLYDLLVGGNRFHLNKEAWLEDVMKIVLALETELNMHMKYFEQSVVGSELFFKPLITLIKRFKSTLVSFAKTGLKYVMGDKIDSGGNSNMFKLFDSIKLTIHFVILAKKGHESQFGLYDTEHKSLYKIIMKDRSEYLKLTTDGFDVTNRRSWMGSIRMVDEIKFFKNGKSIDPSGHTSTWYPGESGVGRWSNEEDFIMKTRTSTERIQNLPVDLDGWREFVESYNPI